MCKSFKTILISYSLLYCYNRVEVKNIQPASHGAAASVAAAAAAAAAAIFEIGRRRRPNCTVR